MQYGQNGRFFFALGGSEASIYQACDDAKCMKCSEKGISSCDFCRTTSFGLVKSDNFCSGNEWTIPQEQPLGSGNEVTTPEQPAPEDNTGSTPGDPSTPPEPEEPPVTGQPGTNTEDPALEEPSEETKECVEQYSASTCSET